LRGKSVDSEDVLEEIDLIVSSINSEKEEGGSKLHELTKFTNIRRILIGCFVQGAQQWTGVTVIVSSYIEFFAKKKKLICF
jgi:hypothetical protein